MGEYDLLIVAGIAAGLLVIGLIKLWKLTRGGGV